MKKGMKKVFCIRCDKKFPRTPFNVKICPKCSKVKRSKMWAEFEKSQKLNINKDKKVKK